MSEQRVASRALPQSLGVRPARNTKDVRRAALFRETPFETFERIALGTAWSLRPKRIGALVPLARMWLSDLLTGRRSLPAVEAHHPELVGIAYDLSVPMLVAAYRRGLCPHGHFGPTKWLSPVTRAVLRLDDFHISKRLRSIMRTSEHSVTFDRDFEGVIKACAGRRAGRWHLTWITPRIMRAFAQLHDEGHVHSFEVWNADGELVGGGYGVASGGVFVIESQFFREPNASKIGFSVLVWHLARWGFVMCDNKWLTGTVERMGFREIPRAEYFRRLAAAADDGPMRRGQWEPEAGPKTVADWRPDTGPN